jgi:hypothetical protein
MHKSVNLSQAIKQYLLPAQARNIMLCHLAKRTIIHHRPAPIITSSPYTGIKTSASPKN